LEVVSRPARSEGQSEAAPLPARGSIEVELVNGEVLINGVPFDEIPVRDWPLEHLQELSGKLPPLLVKAVLKFQSEYPIDDLFLSGAEVTERLL